MSEARTAEVSEDDIRRDFEKDVTDKLDGQCGEVLVHGLHFERL